jgi:CDP-6-deoxy-D-xylo-4-hexulose-3-dehydrase
MSDILNKIKELSKEVKLNYTYNSKDFIPGKSTVLYSGPYWDEEEIEMGLTAFLTGKWLVSGEYVYKFQNAFSKMFNQKHSYMVNSGSSANLVMIAALKKYYGWKDGAEVIVSPVGFPTTITALVQNNLERNRNKRKSNSKCFS